MNPEALFIRITAADMAIAKLVLAGLLLAAVTGYGGFRVLRVADALGELEQLKHWVREFARPVLSRRHAPTTTN